jgi:hypothetical protein
MNGAGRQLLAGAGFSLDQNGRIKSGNFLDQMHCVEECA